MWDQRRTFIVKLRPNTFSVKDSAEGVASIYAIIIYLEITTGLDFIKKDGLRNQFHVVAGNNVQEEMSLDIGKSPLRLLGTINYLKDVDPVAKYSEIEARLISKKTLTISDLSTLCILPVCGKKPVFEKEFLKKCVDLVNKFFDSAKSSPENKELYQWFINFFVTFNAKMLSDENWEKALSVKEIFAITLEFIEYGFVKGE